MVVVGGAELVLDDDSGSSVDLSSRDIGSVTADSVLPYDILDFDPEDGC